MSENTESTTVEAQHSKSHSDGYEVYESPEAEPLKQGICMSRISAEALGGDPIDFITVRVGESENVTAEREKATKNYGVFSAGSAIDSLYLSREVLGLGEDDDVPESVNVTVVPSDEESFNDVAEELESEAEELREEEEEQEGNLLDGASDDDAVEVEEDDDTSEEDLLAEAAEAGE